MIVSGLEKKRLSKISIESRRMICKLTDDADMLWYNSHDNDDRLRIEANKLYRQADKIYKQQILFRKFNGVSKPYSCTNCSVSERKVPIL